MKNICKFFSFLYFIFPVFSFSIDIFLRNDYKKNEEQNIVNQRVLVIDNLKINYQAIYNEEEKKPIRKKWGDFSLGCEFGRIGNGGWDIWNFLSVGVNKDGKNINIERENLIKNIYILENTEERGIAELFWEGEIYLSVKILKYKGLKNWFFMKIESNFPISKVFLSAYPGETTGPKERERWCGFKSGFYNLHKEEGKMKEGDFYVILFNKYGGYQDRYGNFLVFLPDEVNDCRVRGTYGVGIEITPKRDLKEIKFALGYFYNENREEAIENFKQIEVNEIYNKLSKIDWKVNFDFSSFKNIVEEIDKLLENEEAKKLIDENEYKKLIEEGKKFVNEKNYKGILDIVEKIEKLKRDTYEKLLSPYK